jgi:hypothetical protein
MSASSCPLESEKEFAVPLVTLAAETICPA